MIIARGGGADYRVELTNGLHAIGADASVSHGGGGAGLRPHELIEAGLASCIHMTLRMYAKRKVWPLEGLTVRVDLVRTEGAAPRYEIEVDLEGPLDEEQRRRLLSAADACPVKKTLGQAAEFVVGPRREPA